MRLLCFTDLHESLPALRVLQAKIKRYRPDILICAGDFTVFEQRLLDMLKRINTLGPKVLLVHGNHEDSHTLRKLLQRYDNIEWLHHRLVRKEGVAFVGWGGGGFSTIDKPFERWAKSLSPRLRKEHRVILVTHAPFYGTSLDFLGRHYGNKSFTKFIRRHKNVVLGVCGHFHETAGKKAKIGSADVINPGPRGKMVTV